MWASYKRQDFEMKCFLACESYRPSFPMSRPVVLTRTQKLKFFLFGLLFKLGFYF